MVEGAPGRFVGDRYHLIRELGRGGMGVVYLARDVRLDMDVAIKFRGAMHSDATLWLKREFRAVASLRHHNLVELYELVAQDRSCYFTMEYVPGLDPRRWVERADHAALPSSATDASTRSAVALHDAHTLNSGIAPDREAPERAPAIPVVDFDRVRSVLAQLAEGLAFLHSRGVIHRDVKPSNTICSAAGVKLLDFGLALERRRLDEDYARETRVVGTAAYLAPEYLERLAVSPAMDVYALGVLAFELVTGAPPFGGTLHVLSRIHRRATTPRAAHVSPAVPDDLDALIDRMLAHEPGARPSALGVASALAGSQARPRLARRAHRFVGRTEELATLVALIRDPAPRGRLALVRGESGVGKSALTEHALGCVRDPDTLTWRARCHERERVPYRAFDPIIDDLATELAGDPRLARELEHIGALCRVFPVLAPLVDPGSALDLPAADLRVERERALLAMTQLFRRLLRAPRGVIVIDDLQWADDDSLELLALLVERVGAPLTVVASWTDADGVPPAQQALLERLSGAATVLDLGLMPEEQLGQLIAELAPSIPPAQLRDAAVLAAGSPYLAELIGRELGESAAPPAAHEVAAHEVAAPAAPGDPAARDERVAPGALPTAPGATEQRRLARLDADERALAEAAALAGGAVTFEQLRAVSELPSSRVQSALRGLEDARVLRAAPSTTGDPVYLFYHQRLREVVDAGIRPAARRMRHQLFAEWYERTAGAPGQLAYHWQHAGEREHAAAWALAAAEAARAQLAWGIAADWYARALQLGVREPLAARAARADALALAGRLAEAAREFLGLALVDRQSDRWRVRAAEALLKLGELDRGLRVLDHVLESRGQRRARARALTVVRAAQVAAVWLAPVRPRPAPVDEELAAAYRVIASFLSTPYPIEALEYVLRGITLAERSGDRAAQAQGMAMLGAYLAAATLGRFGARAIATAERLAAGAPYPAMVAAGCGGILAMLRGDWSSMRSAHEAGERICRRLGLERSWEASFLRSYWALGELYAGEPGRALVLIDELSGTSDDLWTRAMLGSYRGRALVLIDELGAARHVAAELQRTPAARQGMASIWRQVFLAELALAEHEWARAAQIARELTRALRAQWLSVMPAVSVVVEVISATADLGLARAGDPAAAARAVATAQRVHRRGGTSFYAPTALRLWGQAEAARGRDSVAAPLLAEAAAAARLRGSAVEKMALAALTGAEVPPSPLAAAVRWATGGAVAVPAARALGPSPSRAPGRALEP